MTTWLDIPRWVTGMEPKSGAENAADTPCVLFIDDKNAK
jgi:hypothetical protein